MEGIYERNIEGINERGNDENNRPQRFASYAELADFRDIEWKD